MAHAASKWAVKRKVFGEMTALCSYIQLRELVNSGIVNAIHHNSSPVPCQWLKWIST